MKKKKLKSLPQLKQMSFKNQIKYILNNDIALFESLGTKYNGYKLALFNSAVYDSDPKQKKIIEDEGGEGTLRHAYEYNHVMIMATIQERMFEHNAFPTVTAISQDTNLSRVTVYKHLKNFDTSNYRSLERQKIKLMRDRILTSLFENAINEDNIQAAVTYLKFTEAKAIPQNNKNYIQINNFRISEEVLMLLPENKLIEIEALIKDSIKNESRVYKTLQIEQKSKTA